MWKVQGLTSDKELLVALPAAAAAAAVCPGGWRRQAQARVYVRPSRPLGSLPQAIKSPGKTLWCPPGPPRRLGSNTSAQAGQQPVVFGPQAERCPRAPPEAVVACPPHPGPSPGAEGASPAAVLANSTSCRRVEQDAAGSRRHCHPVHFRGQWLCRIAVCFQPNSQVSTYPRGVEVPYSSRPWLPVTAGEFRHALPIKGPKKWNPATFHRAQSAVSWRSGILVKHREQNRDRFGILILRTAHHNVLEPLTAHPPVPVAAPRGPSSDSAQIMAPAASVRVPVRHLMLLAASLACCRAWEQVGVLPKRWQPPPAACAPSLVPVPVPVAH